MGCGKQVSSRNSAGIIVISSAIERSQEHTAHLANPIEIKNELVPIETVNAFDDISKEVFVRKESPRATRNEHNARDSLFEISKISDFCDENRGKLNTIGGRSPTEVIKRLEERNLESQINFDFLNESSKIRRIEKDDGESIDIEVLMN